jgi:leucyl-tRNA synthetase
MNSELGGFMVFSPTDIPAIEKKWQKAWEKANIFEVKEQPNKKKFYCLEMFPYPSGSGLHMGHAFNYVIGDVYTRFKRMNGYNVLYPMGYDSFGLPAENAAIKEGIHPKEYTEKAIANFIKQQKKLGLSYDWSRVLYTHKPEYYKWDQWIFLKMYEKGLVYRKAAPISYCPKCKTVLANEQVQGGRCWRHKDTDVEIKYLEQWFFKITDYAEELYKDLEKLEGWPENIKAMQRNWIGKSEGIEIDFEINNEIWPIFTTRPDTIYGVTFMVISPHHPRLMEIVTPPQRQKVEAFLKKIRTTKEEEIETLEKEGVFTGSYAVNPLTKDLVPVYVGNFVVAEYGGGMVMAVPAHDQRDFEFAKKYGIEIKVVIQPKDKALDPKKMKKAYVDDGILLHSGDFTGLDNKTAIKTISDYIEKNGFGRRKILYKLRDWLISRQRYWGTPIPMINCVRCGYVPVPESELPVVLPEDVKFGEGNPLETNPTFVQTRCPKCGGEALRETDTMDTFVNSSWYFLRYCDPKNDKKIFDPEKVRYWMPIDQYIGGAEHACMHLIYFRFYTKFLRDIGLVDFDEPAIALFNQGMVHGSDGVVMSKSRGNVIDPLEMIKKYNTDTLRLYLISTASPDKDFAWSDATIEGTFRFLNKIWSYFESVKISDKKDRKIESKYHSLVKEVTNDIDKFRYNFAVISLRRFFESLPSEIDKETLEGFLKLMHPFCPHMTEELWHRLGNNSFISLETWPQADESKIDPRIEENERKAQTLAEDINNVARLLRSKGGSVSKIFVYTLPGEKEGYIENLQIIERSTGVPVTIYSVDEETKYDPHNKSSKAKPGKPAIYLE